MKKGETDMKKGQDSDVGKKMKMKTEVMHIDTARTPSSPRNAPTKTYTIEGFDEYPLRNDIPLPDDPKKVVGIVLVTIVFFVINVILLLCFLAITLLRKFLQVSLLVKKREVRRGVVGPAKDVSDRRICVVGCGSSALVVVKESLELGMKVKAYDSGPRLGGLFACWAYDFGQLTSSNFFTMFGSFPASADDLPVRTIKFSEYVQYLNRFTDHFKLRSHLNFNTEITKVEELPSGKWTVTTKDKSTGQETVEEYTHVVVCNGVNRHPYMPDVPGKSTFGGEIMHSSQYRRPEQVEGKKVLVVGMGESGSDICLEMASKAKHLMITTRSGPGTVLNRYHGKMPNDIDTTRAYHSLPRKMYANPKKFGEASDMPVWWKFKIWIESQFNIPEDDDESRKNASVKFTRYHWMSRYGTKTSGFIRACTDFGASYKETVVTEIDERGAVFKDGTRYDCDVIFFCTGFQREMGILPESLKMLNYRNDLWKHTVHPQYGSRLTFVGFNRPAVGAIPPLAEMSARLVTLLIADRMQLPERRQMLDEIVQDRDYEEWLFPFDAKRLGGLCSHMETFQGLSREVGCDIRWGELLMNDPRLFHRVLFGPVIPASSRLFGHASDYETARKCLFITGMVPPMAQMFKAFLMLLAFNAAQLGLTDPPIGFEEWCK